MQNSSGMLQGFVKCVVMQMEILFCINILNHLGESLTGAGVTWLLSHTWELWTQFKHGMFSQTEGKFQHILDTSNFSLMFS
jgi:hypothetical protein